MKVYIQKQHVEVVIKALTLILLKAVNSFNSFLVFSLHFLKEIYFFFSLYSRTLFLSSIISLIFFFLFQSFHLFERLLLITSGFPLALNDFWRYTLSLKVFEDILKITKLRNHKTSVFSSLMRNPIREGLISTPPQQSVLEYWTCLQGKEKLSLDSICHTKCSQANSLIMVWALQPM